MNGCKILTFLQSFDSIIRKSTANQIKDNIWEKAACQPIFIWLNRRCTCYRSFHIIVNSLYNYYPSRSDDIGVTMLLSQCIVRFVCKVSLRVNLNVNICKEVKHSNILIIGQTFIKCTTQQVWNEALICYFVKTALHFILEAILNLIWTLKNVNFTKKMLMICFRNKVRMETPAKYQCADVLQGKIRVSSTSFEWIVRFLHPFIAST